MAHEIETMAYANEVPWHGLGAQVSDNLLPGEFLKAAGLDWEVSKRPLICRAEDGTDHEIEDQFGLMRSSDHKVLSIVSKYWNPVQNREVLDFFDHYAKAGGVKLETAGSLRGGQMIWGLARLNHDFEVRPGDVTRGYLLFSSSHKPGKATTIRTTGVRVVCANTLAMAENDSATYSQSHMAAFNFDAAKDRVGEAHEQLAQAERQAKVIDQLRIGMNDAVKKVIAPIFAPQHLERIIAVKDVTSDGAKAMPPSIRRIMASIEGAPGAVPGTGWGVLNGVTHYCDHVASSTSEHRMASSWDGVNAKRKLMVESRLLEMAA